MANENSMNETHHLRKITMIWLVLSVIVDLLFWFLVGPHIPPGTMTTSAKGDAFDFTFLCILALPVLIGVWVYMGYAIRIWSAKRPGGEEPMTGPNARTNKTAQVSWIVITSVVVLFLAGFGSVALVTSQGSGGGEGPNPIWMPAGTTKAETAALTSSASWSANGSQVLVVQVIAQQWKFTYRYPQFGGFETTQLVLPTNTSIAFNVTSLDVIHSFWAYQLGVKADANPQENNVAFTKTTQLGTFMVRCSELCGIWHGGMHNSGKVVSQTAFMSWAQLTEQANASNTANLPPFAWTYVPDANGAAGGYYIDGTVTPYSPSEIYGSKQSAP